MMGRILAAAVSLLLLHSIGQVAADHEVAPRRRVRTQKGEDANVEEGTRSRNRIPNVQRDPVAGANQQLEDKSGGTRSSIEVSKPMKVTGGGGGVQGGPLARILGIFGVSKSSEQSPPISSTTERRGIVGRFRKRKRSAEEMLYSDITLAFINGLKSSLYEDLEKPLSEERKQRFLDWLDLLSATLPPEFGLHRIIDLLRSNWIHISSSRNNLMSVLSVSLPASKEYSDECTKATKKRMFGYGKISKTAVRGTTCATWRLFHTVSVGLAERLGGTDASKDDEVLRDVDAALGVVGGKHRRRHRAFSPKEAADILRNTVDSFLACEVCRKNFIEQYDRCEYDRCDRLRDTTENLSEFDWREFPLYLWEYHNGVSATVARKLISEAQAGKSKTTTSQLWPSMDDCLTCRAEDGSWNKQRVYEYLRETYWGEIADNGAAEKSELSHDGGGGFHLDSTSALHTIAALGVAIIILSFIKIWSSWFLRRHNLVGYFPSSAAHFSGKSTGKKE